MQSATLRAMLQQAVDRGDSLRDLQARAVDPQSGETAGKDLIASIVNGTANRIPVERHLRALAAALAVPYERVRQAAIAQWLPGEAAPEQESADREQMRDELIELRNELTAALDRIDKLKAPRRAERPKSA